MREFVSRIGTVHKGGCVGRSTDYILAQVIQLAHELNLVQVIDPSR